MLAPTFEGKAYLVVSSNASSQNQNIPLDPFPSCLIVLLPVSSVFLCYGWDKWVCGVRIGKERREG